MDKMRMESVDITDQNIDKIANLFPSCITEAKDENGKLKKAINFDMLCQLLSKDVVEGDEAYEFTWVGKKNAIIEANTPIRKTLRPCKEESVNWDTTENLYIEGDNLEVLKLLQESYLGKVKMIYIDPPYNTGNDFIYNDDFKSASEEYAEDSGAIDENGDRMFKNTDSNGRFHSDWCSMIYSRLSLARNLLADDGVIFISIDDNEQENLKKMCNEIFGEENFIMSFVWKTRQASGKQIAENNTSKEHEYILCYGKTDNAHFAGINRDRSNYSNPDNDPRGDWAKHPLDIGSTSTERPNCYYDLIDPETGIKYPANPNRVWAYSPDSMEKLLEEGKIIFHPEGKTRPYLKKFWSELKSEKKPMTSWLSRDSFSIGYNTEGTKNVNSLFDGVKLFDYPKPISILRLLVDQITTMDSNSIILDFFSGSATTAHAVMELNAEDGGNRKFIMVQLPEACDEKSEAFKAGYKNICEIGKERIRRAAKKIHEEHPDAKFDDGFRVLKVADSNMTDVYYSVDDYSQNMLTQLESNIKPDRTDIDLLFGCLLEWGLPLSMPYTSEEIESCTVHTYNDGDLIACFDESIPDEVIKEIAKRQPLRAVFRDSSFKNSPSKINVTEIFKMLSPDTSIRVI